MRTVYVSIGNSDNKLTQVQWSQYAKALEHWVNTHAYRVHAVCYSEPTSKYQNAIYSFEMPDEQQSMLRNALAAIAHNFNQDAIALVDVSTSAVQMICRPTEKHLPKLLSTR